MNTLEISTSISRPFQAFHSFPSTGLRIWNAPLRSRPNGRRWVFHFDDETFQISGYRRICLHIAERKYKTDPIYVGRNPRRDHSVSSDMAPETPSDVILV
ncbi:hypothetical protein I7I51_06769 [Histoplasma capsulatum]|uniref:Uncharacterized protein n=1 Tax=Ajellomyces capsulatus TaxID=5037 RepID=A0A8A1MH26_AJECA|nr:predicted protein [Histoplasma mississippiense (nom. inval.)]EDN06385.1 predicted protein [Histoplasma mississippiense (nom. inval.)]QSS65918.1 hypothetical protein I7I51_06769 [Histoplasma capsulatum]